MQALVKATGEVVELNPAPSNLKAVMQAWQLCKEYIEAYTKVKDQLKALVEKHVSSNGTSEPVDGYIFRVSNVQRYNYDKTVLRQQLDEDTFDQLLEPNKSAVDKYLKENLVQLGEASIVIRQAMVPVGKPYTVIKAEKIER